MYQFFLSTFSKLLLFFFTSPQPFHTFFLPSFHIAVVCVCHSPFLNSLSTSSSVSSLFFSVFSSYVPLPSLSSSPLLVTQPTEENGERQIIASVVGSQEELEGMEVRLKWPREDSFPTFLRRQRVFGITESLCSLLAICFLCVTLLPSLVFFLFLLIS